MKEYRLFDISDFVMDEDFIRWVNKNEKADNDFWNNWLRQHPDKHMIIAEARRILESIGTEQKVIREVEIQGEIERLLCTIKGHSEHPKPQIRLVTISRKWWYAAATLLIAIAGTTTYFLLKYPEGSEKFAYAVITPSKHLIENVNTSEEPGIVRLPDGSTVELAGNTRISYANNFDSFDTRDVYLSGEAFFTVTKNPGRPFRVFANEIVTKVLGTSFRVRSFEKDTVIQVTVRTGKVSVYSQAATGTKETTPNHLGGIILTPNQEVVYQKSLQKFQRILLGNPAMILPADADKTLDYDDVSLEKVFNQLGSNYGINIVYDNESLKNCTINADLRSVPFYEKLDLICKAIGASYEVIDGQVVIQANGCE